MTRQILIHNARFGQPSHAAETAIAVEGKHIIAVGEDDEILTLATPESTIIDAQGAVLLPGFYESHMHLFGGALTLERLNLTEVLGLEKLRAALIDYSAQNPDDPVLCCICANYTIAGDDRRITRQLLDEIIPDRPLFISSVDFHTGWANTAALIQANILNGCDLEGASCVVMDDNGLATGELREFEAMGLVLKHSSSGGRENLGLIGEEPESSDTRAFETDLATLKLGLAYCARHGITKIINMDGNFYQLDLIQELERRNELICRVEMPYLLTAKNTAEDLAPIKARMDAGGSKKVTTGRFKLFMDGVFDNWTALVTGSYPDRPDFAGEPLVLPDRFSELCVEADRLGWQISVHAVGDGAVRAVLDGYEAARTANGLRDSRHRVEHIDTLHDDDIARFRELAVIPSMQPVHPPGSAGLPLEPTLSLMGRDRWKNAFAWRLLWEEGNCIPFATDWPTAPLDPLFAIQCAMTRKPWAEDIPDQRLTLDECIQAYTQNGAFAAFDEACLGSLHPGMLADLTLVQGELAQLEDDTKPLPRCILTMCDGNITFRDAEALDA